MGTYSQLVDLLAPQPETIRLEDIAVSLSRQPRYNGHTHGMYGYSVAQHSVWCAGYVRERWGAPARVMLHALLHDAHEAYTGDVPAPVKAIPGVGEALRPVEDQLQRAIYQALGLRAPDREEAALVRAADEVAYSAEVRRLFPERAAGWWILAPPGKAAETIEAPWEADHARSMFLGWFHFLDREMAREAGRHG